jgi:hypothetical protein
MNRDNSKKIKLPQFQIQGVAGLIKNITQMFTKISVLLVVLFGSLNRSSCNCILYPLFGDKTGEVAICCFFRICG